MHNRDFFENALYKLTLYLLTYLLTYKNCFRTGLGWMILNASQAHNWLRGTPILISYLLDVVYD